MGWKHPGRRASDYGKSFDHDHDQRIFATMENFRGKGPKGYRRRDDRIKEEVCEILYWDPDVDASQIEVTVNEGVVHLKGLVDSRHARRRAEEVIEDVSGVVDIENVLSIKKRLDIDSDKLIVRGEDGLYSQEVIQK